MIIKPLKLSHGTFFVAESEISHVLYSCCRFFVVILLLDKTEQQNNNK